MNTATRSTYDVTLKPNVTIHLLYDVTLKPNVTMHLLRCNSRTKRRYTLAIRCNSKTKSYHALATMSNSHYALVLAKMARRRKACIVDELRRMLQRFHADLSASGHGSLTTLLTLSASNFIWTVIAQSTETKILDF